MAVTVDAELERHYNAGAAIPDHMDIFARRAECGAARGARLPARHRVWRRRPRDHGNLSRGRLDAAKHCAI